MTARNLLGTCIRPKNTERVALLSFTYIPLAYVLLRVYIRVYTVIFERIYTQRTRRATSTSTLGPSQDLVSASSTTFQWPQVKILQVETHTSFPSAGIDRPVSGTCVTAAAEHPPGLVRTQYLPRLLAVQTV